MAITYPVDTVNTRWAVYQISTGQIVARNKVWPVVDGGPIPGQDPDFVYLLQSETTPPDYDSRLYQLVGNEAVDVEANTLTLTWSTQARSIEERTEAAINEESYRLGLVADLAKEAVITRLMVAMILDRLLNNSTPPAKAIALANSYIEKGIDIWHNRDRLNQILDDLANGLDPDLDSGWAQ